MLSALQLQRCAIYTRASRCVEILPHLNASLPEAQVDTALRLEMYVGQLEHETDHFRTFEEYANGAAYDVTVNPKLAARLGNTEPGDGPRFKGRGAIQLTGRNNYAHAGLALNLPLLDKPELACLPENAFRVAAWFWVTEIDKRKEPKFHGKHINEYADKGDLENATHVIDGGLNGLLERHRNYDRACEVLGALLPLPPFA